MRLRVIIFMILFFIMLIASTAIIILYNDNAKIRNEINKQISLTNDIKRRDSIYTAKNKKYSQVITKYVDSTYFIMGKKKLSSDDLIKIFNKIDRDNLNREDSLIIYKKMIETYKKMNEIYKDNINENRKAYISISDTAEKYKVLFNYAKQLYNFNLFIIKDSSNRLSISSTFSKADSAEILYKHFKNRMKQTRPGIFTIDITGEPVDINIKEDKTPKKHEN